MVYFRDFKHIYFNDEGQRYLSVTTFIKQFKEKYNEEYWLEYKALEAVRNKFQRDEDGKYLKMKGFFRSMINKVISEQVLPEEMEDYLRVKEELRQQWKDNAEQANTFGTAYHKVQENKDIQSKKAFNKYDRQHYDVIPLEDCKEDNCSRSSIQQGCYLELLIHNDELMLAGQSDKVFFINDVEFDIRDYKTNDKLPMESYNHQKMLYPFDQLDDCSFNHYAVQLSIYAYMLELQGFKCRKLFIDHYEESYEVEYLKDSVEKAFILRAEALSLS